MTLPNEFKALVVTETPDNQFIRSTELKKIDWLQTLTTEASFDELNDKIELMLQGKHVGRTVIRMSNDKGMKIDD